MLESQTVSVFINLLVDTAQYKEAEERLARLTRSVGDLVPDADDVFFLTGNLGRLRIEQGRVEEGISILEAAFREKKVTNPLNKVHLAEGYQRSGQYEKAISLWREVLAVPLNTFGPFGPKHPQAVFSRAGLADCLRASGKPVEAWAVLTETPPEALARLPARHTHLAEFRRVQGLLWLEEKQLDKARTALKEALEIQEFRRGLDHWRTKRVREDLARAEAALAAATEH